MLIEAVSLTVVFVVTLYVYLTWNYNYWRKQGIVQVEPVVPGIGNLLHALLQRRSAFMIHNDIYRKFCGQRVVGFYHLRQPALIIRNPDIIQTVLVTSFSKFHDNMYLISEKVEPLTAVDPFFSTGSKWKENRSEMAPAFTTTRVKNLYPRMQELCGQVNQYLDKNLHKEIDANHLAHQFTTDVVSSCAFGLVSNAVNGEETAFMKYGKIFMEEGVLNGVATFVVFFMSSLAKVLRFRIISSKVTSFIEEMVNTIVDYREKNNVTQNDYLQMIMKLREKNLSEAKLNDKAKQEESNTKMLGHALTFFMEGFETSSMTISYTLYELAMNADVQKKLHEELEEATKEGKPLDYDTLSRLPYLDKVVSETLRKYPILPSMIRLCTESTTLQVEGKPVHIKAGTHIVIPVLALHNDPKWYPNPEKYDPERFSEQNARERHRYCYLPFGEGPRICVGIRFGLAQVKAFLANIVLNYNILKSARTPEKLTFDPMSILLICNELQWIHLQKRERHAG